MKPHDIKRPARNKFRTICQVLREAYVAVEGRSTKKEIIRLLEEAYGMGKRMDAKLREYKKNYDEGFWKPNDHSS